MADMEKEESVFDRCVKIDWPAVWEKLDTPQEVECDDKKGLLQVLIDEMGDLHVFIQKHPEAGKCKCKELGKPSFRARTPGGGGNHERVRVALILLALAMAEDDLPDNEVEYDE